MHHSTQQEEISLCHQDMCKNQLSELIQFTLNHLCLNFIASLLFGEGGVGGTGNQSET